MKTLYKRCLLVGFGLAILALIGKASTAEPAVKVESDKDLDIPPSSPAIDEAIDVVQDLPSGPVPFATLVFPSAVTVTFSGTLVRDGRHFALRETAGTLYALDSIGRAWPYEGEHVRITGKLDDTKQMLHVDAIESAWMMR